MLTNPHIDLPAAARLAVTPPITRSVAGLPVLDEPAARSAAHMSNAALIVAHANAHSLKAALAAPRLAIEKVSPAVDDGAFPVKRTVGDTLRVEADVFMDGHDHIAVALLWRAADANEWNETAMHAIGNDRWAGDFVLDRVGSYVFTVEAWRDTWATLRAALEQKLEAGLTVAAEINDACAFIEQTAQQAPTRSAELDTLLAQARALSATGQALDGNTEPTALLDLLRSPATAATLAASERRAFVLRLDTRYQVDSDRHIAAFASWYELLPRSQGTTAEARLGNFSEVIERMPAIRDMGFDVLYLPPIHPIGKSHRKDPDSAHAIGSHEGGHDAIHAGLGDFDGDFNDFARMLAAATAHGLEIALDFAIQCSPDHPWLRDHPEWFQRRADGSLQQTGNPDDKTGVANTGTANVDFYAGGGANGPVAPALWRALRDIVLFWASHNIRIFRVSNPHTKPLSFWQWLIAEVRGTHPDVIFLAEAFTRPKVMARLAKIGYSQSYTCFTWRESKEELSRNFSELSSPPLCEFFRPHLLVNTPDIHPRFLQRSGRAGFVVRAALAGFLSGLWGLHSGFEMCEAASTPDREDRHKRKNEIDADKQRGNIIREITLINRIRRTCPALQSHLGLAFHRADNEQVLFFSRTRAADAPGNADDIILVAINLDPVHVQESYVELPVHDWGLPDDGEFLIEDMVSGDRWVWCGKHQSVKLDPAVLPFLVWRVTPLASADTHAAERAVDRTVVRIH